MPRNTGVRRYYLSSSNVHWVEYWLPTRRLTVAFKYGRVYEGLGILPSDVIHLLFDDSPGAVYNQVIAPNYNMRYVGDYDSRTDTIKLLVQETLGI